MHISAGVQRITWNASCMTISGGRAKQTTRYILPHHWLYEWFSQFRGCGTYSVLSRSPSYVSRHWLFLNIEAGILFYSVMGNGIRKTSLTHFAIVDTAIAASWYKCALISTFFYIPAGVLQQLFPFRRIPTESAGLPSSASLCSTVWRICHLFDNIT